jgi:hypothetical protein
MEILHGKENRQDAKGAKTEKEDDCQPLISLGVLGGLAV